MSKFQNHFSPRKKSFFDPIFFLVKNMYLDFTIKAVRKRFAQMVHFRSTIPRNLLLASFIQCGLHIKCVREFMDHPSVFLGPLREFLELGDGFGHFR